MSNLQKYNPVDSLYGSCYLSTATHSKWNQHIKQMMILHEKFISMKIISLDKYASLQKQTETTIKYDTNKNRKIKQYKNLMSSY